MNVRDDNRPSRRGTQRLVPGVHEGLGKCVARCFSAGVSEGLKIDMEALDVSMEKSSVGVFNDSLEDPSCVFVLEAGASAAQVGSVICGFSPPIAFAMLDRLLGGSAQDAYMPSRSLTSLERGLMGAVLDCLAGALGHAIPQLAPFSCNPDRAYGRGDDSASVIIARFALTMGVHSGAMRLGFAEHMLDNTMICPLNQTDSPVELSVMVEESAVSSEDLEQLQDGDIIVTQSPVEGEVVVRLAGIPKFMGKLVSSNGKRAIRITRCISSPARRD